MALIFPILLFVILIACIACLYTEGMWGNAVRLINVVTAALLATNFYEPAAAWLDEWQPSFTYLWDFLVLWGLFVVSMTILRLATDFLSRVKVRLLTIADRIGSVVLAAWIGWVIVCFTTMSLHTAPLGRNFMFGGFVPDERAKFLGMAPDRQWLAFVQKMSLGPLARSGTPQELESEKHVFDPRAEFMPKYTARRAGLEAHVNKTQSLRVR